jgi:hypothetical protein
VTLFAGAPSLATHHPLRPYADYMMSRVDTIYWQNWGIIGALVLFAIAFLLFAYQKWRERQDVKAERAEVRSLLATIKGWTAVNDAANNRVVVIIRDELQRAAEPIAKAVVEKAKAETPDSGIIPRTDPVGGGT